jgi:ABC-type nitrate/sulfonate/bicarbonate transport system permease component
VTASARGALRPPASRPVDSRPLRFGRSLTQRWLVLAILVVLWEVAALASASIFFPPPSDIAARMRELWLSGEPPLFLTQGVTEDILPSLGRMFAGWGIAAALGIAAGVAIGTSRAASDAVLPALHFLRSIPGPALLPVFLVLLGTGTSMRVVLIAFGTIWPVLLNTMDGVRTVEPIQLETARVFGLRRWPRFRWVVLPAAMPKIIAGLRIAISIALILMVISELVGATDGIGHQMTAAQQQFLLTDLWAGIALLAILGYVLNMIFESVERRILRWHRGARQATRPVGP